MTDREKAIVMAYTGIVMLKGDKFKVFHGYVEELFGREVYTHEFLSLHDEIKERSKPDFLKLCEEGKNNYVPFSVMNDCITRLQAQSCITSNQTRGKMIDDLMALPPVKPNQRTGKWKVQNLVNCDGARSYTRTIVCSECGIARREFQGDIIKMKYCPNCGAKMAESEVQDADSN